MVKVADRHTDFTLSGRGTKMIPMSRPRLAVDTRGKGIYYIYRDVDRNSCLLYTSYDVLLRAEAIKQQEREMRTWVHEGFSAQEMVKNGGYF